MLLLDSVSSCGKGLLDILSFERTQILSGIQFTRHSIEFKFVVVETKKFDSINPHVILTQQTCGQCSNMFAGSKRRALELFFFRTKLLYMFLIFICKRRVGSRSVHNFGTCKKNNAVWWRLLIQKRVWLQNSSEFAKAQRHSFCMHRNCHRPRSNSLHFDIEKIWRTCTPKQNVRHPADILERWTHVCCFKITITLLPKNCFVSTTTNSMKCLVNWCWSRP